MSGHETLGDAWVAIRGDGAKFPSDIKGVVEKGLSDTAKKGAEILGGMFIGAKFTQAAKAGLEELKQAAATQAQTEAAIASTGGAAGVTAGHVDELSKSLLGLSGTDDEIITKGQDLLLSFQAVRNEAGKGNDVFDRATKAGLDLATRGFGSVEGNARLLGIALSDPEKGLTRLRRAGVVLTDQQTASIKGFQATGDMLDAQKVLLDAVEGKVGGAAKAYGETLPGKLAIAHESLKNAEAELVSGAAPALELFSSWVTTAANAVQTLPGPLQTVISVVATAGVGFVAIARPLGAVIQLYDRFFGSAKAAGEIETVTAAETVAAEEAKTAAVVETTSAMSAADIANLKRVATNTTVKFSDAEVATAIEARTLAEFQALVGNDALIASDAELAAAMTAASVAAAEESAVVAELAAFEAAYAGITTEAAGATVGAAAATDVLAASSTGLLVTLGPVGLAVGILAGAVYLISQTAGDGAAAVKALDDAAKQLGDDFLTVGTGSSTVESDLKRFLDTVVANTDGTNTYRDTLTALGITTGDFAKLLDSGSQASGEFIQKLLFSGAATEAQSRALGDLVQKAADHAKVTLQVDAAQGKLTQTQIDAAAATHLNAAGTTDWTATLAALEPSIVSVKAAADGSAPSIDDLRASTDTLTEAEKELVKAADAAAAAHAAFPDFVNSLVGAMDKAYQSLVSGTQATATYEKSINTLEDSLKKNGASLDVVADKTGRYSEKALANQDAVLAVGASISKLIEQRFQDTHSTEDAIAVGQMYVDNLTAQLQAAGYNADQIAEMIRVMHLTPEDINTTFSNNAVEQQIVIGKYIAQLKDVPPEVRSQLEAEINQGQYDLVNQQLAALAAGRKVTFTPYVPEKNYNIDNGVQVRAAGGPVSAGEWYRVNETGREYFQPAVDGTILSADRVERALSVGARGGSPDMSASSLTIQVTVDARGATPETARAVGESFGAGLAATLVKRRLAVTAATTGTR